MNRIATFFRTFIKSLTNPPYYQDVAKAPSSFSWKYFFGLNLISSLLTSIMFIVPIAAFALIEALTSATSAFPNDLQVKLDGSGISINQPLPYSVPVPDMWQEPSQQVMEDRLDNIVTFTTDDQMSGLDDFSELSSFAVITESTVYMLDDNDTGEVRAYPVPTSEQPYTLDKPTIDNAINQMTQNPFFKHKLYVPLFALIMLVVVWPLMTLYRAVVLLFYALGAWILSRMLFRDKVLSYGKVFQLSLHSITLPIVIGFVLSWFNPGVFTGWLHFAVYLIWTLVGISNIKSVPATTSASGSYAPVTATSSRPAASKAKAKTTKARKR